MERTQHSSIISWYHPIMWCFCRWRRRRHSVAGLPLLSMRKMVQASNKSIFNNWFCNDGRRDLHIPLAPAASSVSAWAGVNYILLEGRLACIYCCLSMRHHSCNNTWAVYERQERCIRRGLHGLVIEVKRIVIPQNILGFYPILETAPGYSWTRGNVSHDWNILLIFNH